MTEIIRSRALNVSGPSPRRRRMGAESLAVGVNRAGVHELPGSDDICHGNHMH